MSNKYIRIISQTCLLMGTLFAANAQNGVGVNTNTPRSSFEDNGSFGKKVTTVTAATTTLDETYGSVVCNTGSTVVTLPVATGCAARVYEIKRAVGNASSVTINVTSGGTIDGATSFLLSKAGQSVTVFSDGAVWLVRDGSGEGNNWSLTGNTGTTPATNFLGTIDAQDFVVRTTNSERMRVLAGGNVGIGTILPEQRLHVSGEVQIGNDPGISGESNKLLFGRNGNNSDVVWIYRKNNGLNDKSMMKIGCGDNYNAASTIAEDFIDFINTNREDDPIMRINTGTGNIGINTNTPTARLHVVADQVKTTNFAAGLLSNIATSTTAAIIKKGLEVSSTGAWTGTNIGVHVTSVTGGGNNYDAIFNGGGNVGIGTLAPLSLLETSGSFGKKVTTTGGDLTLDGTHSTIVCTNAGVARTLTLPAAAGVTGRIYEIKKDASSTGNITLSGGGNIDGAVSLVMTGINTAVTIFSDGTEWKTMQGGRSQNGTAWNILGNSGTVASTNFLGTTDNVELAFRINNTERARLTTGGSLGLGTTAADSYGRLTVMSNGEGVFQQDNIAIVSNNPAPSPSLKFFSSRGVEGAKTNLANGDDILRIHGYGTINGVAGQQTSRISSTYQGNGLTNLSDLSFMTSNTERMIIDEEGDVGINEFNPTAKLHISENSPVATPANTLPLILQNSVAGNLANTEVSLRLSPSTSEDSRGVDISAIQKGGNNIDMKISLGGSASPGVPTEKVRITADGDIGLRVSVPSFQLSINGNAAETIGMERHTTAATAGNRLQLLAGGAFSAGTNLNGGELRLSSGTSTGTGTSNLAFYTATAGLAGTTDNTPTEKMRILGNGDVGIGTTAPSCRLDVRNDATGTVGDVKFQIARQNQGDVGMTFNQVSVKSYGIVLRDNTTATGTAGRLAFVDSYFPGGAGTEIMCIGPVPNGNVGIGVNAPAYKLDVNGDVNISSDNNLIVRGMSMLAKTHTGALVLMNNGQGSYLAWNQTVLSGGVASLGYTNFINHRGTSPSGGFTWNNTSDMATFTDMMTLTMNNVPNTPSLGILTNTPNSNLEVNGSFAANVTTINGVVNLALDHTHHVIIITGGTPTISLPAAGPAVCPKRIYHITNTTATPRAVAVSTYVELNGTPSSTIPANTGISIISDGTTWRRFR